MSGTASVSLDPAGEQAEGTVHQGTALARGADPVAAGARHGHELGSSTAT